MTFISHHEKKGNLGPTKRMLLILDGHKSHVILEVLLKAMEHGIDMVSLPSHSSHEMQPLNISYFKPFKQYFRVYRDIWCRNNIGNKATKQDLARWMSLGLQKTLTVKNIQAGFRIAGIQPLNKVAMVGKTGLSELFQHSHEAREESEDDDVVDEAAEVENHILIEEVLEGLPSPPRQHTQYFVSLEDDSSSPCPNSTIADPDSTQPISQFLRLPETRVSRSSRIKSESLVDYSHSQILTSNDHVGKLITISTKKAMVEEERATKQKERELTKARRAEERVLQAVAKRKRASDLEAKKLTKKLDHKCN